MPLEIRQIVFSPQESITAIVEYCRKRNITIPVGTITHIYIDERPVVSAALEIEETDGEGNVFRMSGENLAAAMIMFCLDHKILLPSDGDKRLSRIADDTVALLIIKRTKT